MMIENCSYRSDDFRIRWNVRNESGDTLHAGQQNQFIASRQHKLIRIHGDTLHSAIAATDSAEKMTLDVTVEHHHRLNIRASDAIRLVRDGDDELMAFVLAHAVRGIIEGALMYRPDLFDEPGFSDELFKLVSRYTAPREPGEE